MARTASPGEQGAGGDTNARKTARTASQKQEKREGERAEWGGVTAGGDMQKSKYVKMLIMLYIAVKSSSK